MSKTKSSESGVASLEYLTEDELRSLFQEIGKDPQPPLRARNGALFSLMFLFGLRSSELLALKVENIDFPEKTIRLHRRSGEGVFPLPARVIGRLLEWLDLRASWGKEGASGYLFTARYSKKTLSIEEIFHLFRKYARAAGFPISKQCLSILRNTAGVRLASSGANPDKIRSILGLPHESGYLFKYLNRVAPPTADLAGALEVPSARLEFSPAVLTQEGEKNV